MAPLTTMFSLINNASQTNMGSVQIPTSKKALRVLEVLYREGLIRGYVYNSWKTTIYIKFSGSASRPVIKHILAISLGSRRVFVSVKILAKLIHANETFLLSTSRGILTLRQALEQNIGGILLCKII